MEGLWAPIAEPALVLVAVWTVAGRLGQQLNLKDGWSWTFCAR